MSIKILSGILALLLIGVAVLSFQMLKNPKVQTASDSQQIAKSFSSADFELQYSPHYVLSTDPNVAQNYFAKGKTLAAIVLPKETFPKTNFGESYVAIAKSDQSSTTDCKAYYNGTSTASSLQSSEQINGINFDKAEFSDAGAGNFYETRLYRTLYGSTCYEITATLHTTNIGNYPPGTVTELNKGDAWGKLVQIINTVKLKDNPPQQPVPTQTSKTGTLAGHVDIGPNCPVEIAGKPCPPSPDSYAATQILIYKSDGKTLVSAPKLDLSGNYSVNLDPGNYLVDYQRTGSFYSHYPQPAKIKAGQTTTLNFTIDTGIR
jgi:hypothetical protein